ncbi:MAG: hypothetical protein HWN70_12640 [Desulfobacterales bacterium]|nr:hypothetical protein [Desulfobacterales bacterium]
MPVKPWWQVATPHKDIREGRLDEAVFAADLGDVVHDRDPMTIEMGTEYLQYKVVMERAFGEEDEKKDYGEIWEAFLRFPELPILEDEGVLKDAMIQGAKNQKLGILVDDRIIYGEDASEDTVSEGVFIVKEGPAKELKAEQVGEEKEVEEEEGREEDLEEISAGKFRKIRIKAQVPWDKLAAFMSGVLAPLQQEGAKTTLEVEVSAESEKGISKDTLELRVKETLDQIGAKILEWPEE